MANAALQLDTEVEDLAEIPADAPLRLRAECGDDLSVLAALLQGSVGKVGDAAYLAKKRRFVALVNRLRWEDAPAAEQAGRSFQRVRCALTVENVLAVRARGVCATERDTVYGLVSLRFEPGADCTGVLRLLLTGGCEIAVEVEALSLFVEDVSRPWAAKGAPELLPD